MHFGVGKIEASPAVVKIIRSGVQVEIELGKTWPTGHYPIVRTETKMHANLLRIKHILAKSLGLLVIRQKYNLFCREQSSKLNVFFLLKSRGDQRDQCLFVSNSKKPTDAGILRVK